MQQSVLAHIAQIGDQIVKAQLKSNPNSMVLKKVTENWSRGKNKKLLSISERWDTTLEWKGTQQKLLKSREIVAGDSIKGNKVSDM